MRFLPALLDRLFYVISPLPIGWFFLLIWAGVVGYLFRAWRRYQPAWNVRDWLIFFALLVLAIVSNLFLGLGLNGQNALPFPGLPMDESVAVLMPLSAIPWLIAAGILGPWGGFLTAGIAGLVRAPFDTHNPFMALEFAFLGLIAAASMRQRYRTLTYRLASQPFITALLLVPLRLALYLLVTLVLDIGSLPARVDYALSRLGPLTLGFSGEMVIAGLVAQALFWKAPPLWGDRPLEPSPAETRLETRFLLWTGNFILVLFVTLLGAVWVVAGNSAREMFQERLSSTANTIVQSIPFFLETGQNLVLQAMTDPALLKEEGTALSARLAHSIQSSPYFDQMVVLSVDGERILGAYPSYLWDGFALYPEEQVALKFATGGAMIQIYTLPPQPNEAAARVSFIGSIVDEHGKAQRVLIARTLLDHNPL
ncbi:MAG: hypothetical protein ACK8QZ_01925, partial [Anaerolineales bacterium]